MSSHVHKKSNAIASAAWADYSRFIVPADTEVLDKLGARSFYVDLFVCLLLSGTSALVGPLVLRIVEVEHTSHVKNDLK